MTFSAWAATHDFASSCVRRAFRVSAKAASSTVPENIAAAATLRTLIARTPIDVSPSA